MDEYSLRMIADRVIEVVEGFTRVEVDSSIYIIAGTRIHGPYEVMRLIGLNRIFASKNGKNDIIQNNGNIKYNATEKDLVAAVEESINDIVDKAYDIWEPELTFKDPDTVEFTRMELPIEPSGNNMISAYLEYSCKGKFIRFERIETEKSYCAIYNVKEGKWALGYQKADMQN